MSHSLNVPDKLFETIQGVANERGTSPIEVIDHAMKHTFGQINGRDNNDQVVGSPKTLGDKLRRSMRTFCGRPGTERLSEQRIELSQDQIDRIMGQQ